ncbi:Ig-like domain-containing protein [Siccibacter colletis]|uniref:Ig-like domain-containing protein n=1 Tax=Siccibacter colletis TaxID=1505757 RepID=UPI003CFB2972
MTVSGPASVKVGETIALVAAVEPADAESYTLTWAVDDAAIATIDPDSGEVSGVAAGDVAATCTAHNGDGSTVASEAHTVTVTEA